MIPSDNVLELPAAEQMQNVEVGFIHYIKPGNSYRNIRSGPRVEAQDRGDLFAYEGIRFYPDSNRDGWYYVQKLNALDISGWVLIDGIELIFVHPYQTEHMPSAYMSIKVAGYNLNVTTEIAEG